MDEMSHGSIEDGAAIGLLAVMFAISQECWCAGWIDGLEYRLWQVVQAFAPGDLYGQCEISINQALLLRHLSYEAGGWWVWGGDRPEFLTLQNWKARYAQKGS